MSLFAFLSVPRNPDNKKVHIQNQRRKINHIICFYYEIKTSLVRLKDFFIKKHALKKVSLCNFEALSRSPQEVGGPKNFFLSIKFDGDYVCKISLDSDNWKYDILGGGVVPPPVC